MSHLNTEHPVMAKARRLLLSGVFDAETDAVVREFLATIEFHIQRGNAGRVISERNILEAKLQDY